MNRGGPARRRRRLRILVTAGPTRERIDPVRYLSNDSSGRMGFEIAREARRRGHRAVLIAGPVDLATPPGVERIDVESAREMLAAARPAFAASDALYMAAAVCDWRPRRRRSGKWKKKDGAPVSLELVENPDVLATLTRSKGPRLVVGFALETGRGEARARAKLARKRADYIVLNDPGALGSARVRASVLGRDGSIRRLPDLGKRVLASRLLDLADGLGT